MWSNLVSNPRRGLRLLGLFLLTLGVGALALPSFGRMDIRGVSILDLELMRTSANAVEYVARLGPDGVDAAKTSIYLDFPFLVLYAVALSASCVVLAARAAERGRTTLASAGRAIAWTAPVAAERGRTTLASAGRTIAWAAPIAAALDAVENIALLQVLSDRVDQPWPGLAFGFASVKFALLAVVVVYLGVGLARTAERVPTSSA